MFRFSQSLLYDNGAKARVDEQLIIFYSLQRKDRIKEQFCYKRRDLIKRSQIAFKNTTSRIFFQIPFILCCDYIRQQVRIDCREHNTDSKLGLTFFVELLGEIGKKNTIEDGSGFTKRQLQGSNSRPCECKPTASTAKAENPPNVSS